MEVYYFLPAQTWLGVYTPVMIKDELSTEEDFGIILEFFEVEPYTTTTYRRKKI